MAGADDHHRLGVLPQQMLVRQEATAHGVEREHPRQVQPGDVGPDGHRAGPDRQPAVGEFPRPAAPVDYRHGSPGGIDPDGGVLEPESDAVALDRGGGVMGQPLRVGHLAAHVERQPADAVVGEGVGHDDADLQFGGPPSTPRGPRWSRRRYRR